MVQEPLSSHPCELVRFVEWYESNGSILCQSDPEMVASCLRVAFGLRPPLELPDAGRLINRLPDVQVFLQPGLEQLLRCRGFWVSADRQHIVLVEPTRPAASRIKTLFHEVAEQLLCISYELHPGIREKGTKVREAWANKVAAFVKMPAEEFRAAYAQCRLDLEVLKDECKDTIAGVARHVRDLELRHRPLYVCRFDIVWQPQRKCQPLVPVIQATGGPCVAVRDLVRTEMIVTTAAQGALPMYNLPTSDHFRVLHPAMNAAISARRPVFLQSFDGGASDQLIFHDLFGYQQLCALLIPYGKRRTAGFLMVAVHPNDRRELDGHIARMADLVQLEVEWLFSRASYTRERKAAKSDQPNIPGINQDCPLPGLFFGADPYPWAA